MSVCIPEEIEAGHCYGQAGYGPHPPTLGWGRTSPPRKAKLTCRPERISRSGPKGALGTCSPTSASSSGAGTPEGAAHAPDLPPHQEARPHPSASRGDPRHSAAPRVRLDAQPRRRLLHRAAYGFSHRSSQDVEITVRPTRKEHGDASVIVLPGTPTPFPSGTGANTQKQCARHPQTSLFRFLRLFSSTGIKGADLQNRSALLALRLATSSGRLACGGRRRS